MRRLILLAAFVAASLMLPAVAAPAALAADPMCSIHDEDVTSWGVADDHVDTDWHFKCGGAFNDSWFLRVYLQWRDGSGFWHTYPCDNGQDCTRLKPNSGCCFAAGSEHQGTDTWNVATGIDCDYLRFHVNQVFLNYSNVPYNSRTYHIGSC